MPGQDSMVSIRTRLKRCLKLWGQEPERDEEKPFSLVTKDLCNRSFVRPTSPCQWMVDPLLRISCADELLSQLEVEDDLEKLKELWGAQGVLLQPLWRGGEREAGP